MRSLLALICSAAALLAADRPAFFAMDTAARLEPAACAQTLAEFGYAGLGGRPATAKAHADALKAKGLVFFNGYHVANFPSGQHQLPADLTQAVDWLAGTGGTLWLGINKVDLPLGLRMPPEYGDTVVVPQLRQLVAYARSKGVKISLYPHAGFWAASFETCVRVAGKVDDPDLGVTFNLCHWLKVEGSERDPAPLIKEALPRLNFITINGADAGDTQDLGWDKLIQPLGRGTYDVGAFVAKARAAGYRGPFGFQGYGIKMEPKELLKETMEGWRKMVK
ncbi:MAG: sugar phosphate isomerase/epimerase [Verrucomicrobia bacterium]|nr:sugar phosphate isomerase/epimerase [Verrucomicrobiota bacterium]